MFTESFHRLLKVVYFSNKQNHRVDSLIHTLLRVSSPNLIYEQLQKAEERKVTNRRCEINKRHKFASEFYNTSVHMQVHEQDSDQPALKIEPHGNKGNFYIIEQQKTDCTCGLRCSNCDNYV